MKKKLLVNRCDEPIVFSSWQKPWAVLCATCAGLHFSYPAIAVNQLLTFDFKGETGLLLDGLESGISELASVQLNASAIGGKFNLTATGFGIDSPGSDDSDALDGSINPESIQFSFSSSGKLTNLNLDRFTSAANDSFSISYDSQPKSIYTKDDLSSNNSLLLDLDFNPGEIFTLSWESGNGFGLASISAELTPVPEPHEYALFASGGLLLYAFIRRKKNHRHIPSFFS